MLNTSLAELIRDGAELCKICGEKLWTKDTIYLDKDMNASFCSKECKDKSEKINIKIKK